MTSDGSYLERATEAPEEVVLRRELIRTPGLQPEDIGVLSELLLRDPGRPSTAAAVRKDFQALGWKMGRERYAGIEARLTKAGHLARIPAYDVAEGRPTWITRVYRNPANNQQYVDLGISASLQVSDEMRETSTPDDEHGPEVRETRVSPGQSRNAENPQSGAEVRKTRNPETRVSPGQSRNAENPQSGAEVRKTRNPETRVSPGQSRNAENPQSGGHPPHPPEEVTTSSPSPLTSPSGNSSLPSPREEGEAGYAEEDLQAAADVLELLPDPWTQGKLNASKLAPKLLGAMAVQGWPGIHAVDRALLTRQLTKNPHKITNPYRLLAGDRIPNLPRYAVVSAEAARSRPAGATADGMCPQHPQYRAGSRCIPCVSA